jgi:hypothetical protein
MKQNKTETYQICFLSTDDIVSKDKDIMKRDTIYKPGHIFPPPSLHVLFIVYMVIFCG